MFEHFIIMTSSYDSGSRIALQYAYQGGIDSNEIERALVSLQDICDGKFSFSTHYVCTDDESWESVVSYDSFFEDVLVVDSLEEFIYFIHKDMRLSGLDVAKYILSKHKCTHLELEKLTYLSYADYLCKFGKRLCDDIIYAFTYGPVIDSVYGKYAHHKEMLTVDIDESISKSRILVLPDGMEKIKSIDGTLAKYAGCSASDLVDITHADHSPWKMKDATKLYQIIDDELIREHHVYEEQYFKRKFEGA